MPITKKSPRTTITPKQNFFLCRYSYFSNNPNKEEIKLLAKMIGMTSRTVDIWFQNHKKRFHQLDGINDMVFDAYLNELVSDFELPDTRPLLAEILTDEIAQDFANEIVIDYYCNI
jgi:hypothetical protein